MINNENFAHLHVHTEFSVLDGINRVDKIPSYVKDNLGHTSLACTEHGNIAGSYKFYNACKKVDIKPILGMEAYYTVESRLTKAPDADGESYYHLILLAKNRNGFANLRKLSSLAYTEGRYRKPRLDDELLSLYSKDLIATSACLGSRTSQLILKDRKREAETLLLHHAEIFKDNFFIELQLHKNEEQQKVNQVLLEFSAKHKLPIILTNDAHYTHESHKEIHEQALCIQTHNTLSNPKRFTFGDIDVHLASTTWMAERAIAQGIPLEAITNTKAIADSIDANYFGISINRYPKFQWLPKGIASWDALERLCKHSLYQKMKGHVPDIYKQRINKELKVIKSMGFSDYLLIVQDFVLGAKSVDCEVGPGRGSAAGSLVVYALGITQIDPIKYDLPFERFLNEGRGSTPVIFSEEQKKKLHDHKHSGTS